MIQLGLSASPVYLGATGLFWAITLGAAAVGLWRLRAWGRWLGLGAVSLYCMHTWLNRFLFDLSAYARQVWPWEAAVSLLSLALTWGILWLPGVRASFGREVSHEWRGRP